tara:strand:+ start:649 stop:1170 length:522 start_codon:yes stop_codon:yes gene_type:complete
MLIKPKIIKIKDIDDIELNYQISRISAIHFIELLKIYPFDSEIIPVIEHETLLSLLKYVSYYDDDKYIVLDDEYKINKYIPDAETLLKIETRLILYNIEFMKTRKRCRLYNGGEEPPYKYVNIDSGVAAVISNKFATMQELRTVYDYEDYSNMLEIIQVNISNEIHASKKKQI